MLKIYFSEVQVIKMNATWIKLLNYPILNVLLILKEKSTWFWAIMASKISFKNISVELYKPWSWTLQIIFNE